MTQSFDLLGAKAILLVNSVGGPQIPLWLGIIFVVIVVIAIVVTQVRRR